MTNLFKTRKQREQDARRERRQAFRQAENAIDDVKDRIRQLEKEAKKQWELARDAMKGGQQEAARRLLVGYRAGQVLATKLEQKRWVFEQYFTRLQAAASDQQFTDALAAINKVVNIQPDRVADVFAASQDLLGEQVDSEHFWERLHEKETAGAAAGLEDHIPSLDALAAQLAQEAAVAVGGAVPDRINAALDDRINQGQERVKKLLG